MNKKECRVCGDEALARNFCALTCESCKAFFRRNANKLDEFQCIYGNECQIDLDTRKRCRKCRLKKCFQIGMKKAWILNEEEKKERLTKIEQNRRKKNQNNNCFDTNSDSLLSETSVISSTDCLNSTIDSNSEQTLQIYSSDNRDNSLDNNLSNYFGEYSSQLVPISRPLTDYRNNLTEMESNYFTELLNSSNYLTVPNTESILNYEVITFSEAMRLVSKVFDREIRKLIKTAKHLRAFKIVCREDQISLLKYCSDEISFMRSVQCYSTENEFWKVNMDENGAAKMKLEVFKQKSLIYYSQSKLAMDELAKVWDSDQIILHLLMAIVLFEFNRPDLRHKDLIMVQQQIYKHLLQRYLLLKYRTETESKSKFTKLMEFITDLHVLHEKIYRKTLEGKGPDYEYFVNSPLLQELYCKNGNPSLE